MMQNLAMGVDLSRQNASSKQTWRGVERLRDFAHKCYVINVSKKLVDLIRKYDFLYFWAALALLVMTLLAFSIFTISL